MNSNELRKSFFDFFEKRGHTALPSSSLIPPAEPTLYFTNAGMVQFKGVFLGTEKKPYKKAVTIQKCLRVSGKHNDLEQVGHTPRHHTFFEMMGNFSFGDYFKEEAIVLAWEYLTEELKLSKDRLIATVFEKDDEALKLWTKFLPKEKIFKLGEKDNFWSMGDVGPCGPCSEIIWDFGKGAIKPSELDSPRFVEIWNLVFMQFNRDEHGSLTALSKPSIDTGMGLERLASVIEGRQENWTTDIFMPIISAVSKATEQSFGKSKDIDIAMKVIADHLRGMVFMIDAGLVPSNEGRGYILRRIIRRAIRYGKRLGKDEPFLSKLSHVIIDHMGEVYPEIVSHYSTIEKVIFAEEDRFFRTLDKGLDLLENEFSGLEKEKKKTLRGDVVFKLYDTYGFPSDLTELIAKEKGLEIDREGFESSLEKQRAQSKASWKGTSEVKADAIYQELAKKGVITEFVGYELESAVAKLLYIIKKGIHVDEAKEGDSVELIFDRTPFYGESGGQVGDIGMAICPSAEVEITNVKRPLHSLVVHSAKIKQGSLKKGIDLTLAIDSIRRQSIKCNHTATHLLHKALREVLGEHVRQSGSLVEPDRLRFDFSHFQAVTMDELEQIERLANQAVRQNLSVETHVIPYGEALSKGALAFFGEKYQDVVRMVKSADFSCELCGGTHVKMTGEIGLIKIVSESSIAAGIRRIEAITAKEAENFVYELQREKNDLAITLRAQPNEIKMRIEKLLTRIREIEGELCSHKERELGNVDDLIKSVKKVGDISTLCLKLPNVETPQLRALSDQLRSKMKSGILLLASVCSGKVLILVSVSKDLQDRFHAGKLVAELSPIVDGKGGGKPDMAQGGGTDPSKLSKLLEEFERIISAALQNR